MANTTDSGFAPVDDDGFRPGAATPRRDFDRPGAPPFGDPDQQLYGSGWHGAAPPNTPAGPDESPYEGRHRAAE